jgi:tol-pal system protein YbgF
MKSTHARATSLVALAGFVAAGCATGNRDELVNTVWATNRKVQVIERDLGETSSRVNEVQADLTARVNEAEQEVNRLQGTLEETEYELQQVQSRLDRLMAVLYEEFNLTMPSDMGGRAGPQGPSVTIGTPGTQMDEPAPGLAEPPPLPERTQPPADAQTQPAASEQPPATPTTPVDFYRQAQQSFLDENFEQALAQYGQFVQRYPNSDFTADAQYWLAESHRRLENYPEAIGEYRKLREQYPTSPKVPFALYNQAVCHLRLRQSAQAIELLQTLVDDYPMTSATEMAKPLLRELQGAQ